MWAQNASRVGEQCVEWQAEFSVPKADSQSLAPFELHFVRCGARKFTRSQGTRTDEKTCLGSDRASQRDRRGRLTTRSRWLLTSCIDYDDSQLSPLEANDSTVGACLEEKTRRGVDGDHRCSADPFERYACCLGSSFQDRPSWLVPCLAPDHDRVRVASLDDPQCARYVFRIPCRYDEEFERSLPGNGRTVDEVSCIVWIGASPDQHFSPVGDEQNREGSTRSTDDQAIGRAELTRSSSEYGAQQETECQPSERRSGDRGTKTDEPHCCFS